MAIVSRSSRKSKNEESTSSKKCNGGKSKDSKVLSTAGSATETSGLRRSTREPPSKKQRFSSPLSTRKSKRLEKKKALTLVKRKKERIEKQRGEKYQSSSSPALKKSGKSSGSSETKKKKVKKENAVKKTTLITGEQTKSEKQNRKNADLTSKKKKRLDARSYRALLKSEAKKIKQPDAGESCRSGDNSSQVDSENTGSDGSEEVEGGVVECSRKGDKLRGKNLQKESKETVKGKNIRKEGTEAVGKSSSGSIKLVDEIAIDGNGKIASTRVNKKRKFGVEEAKKSRCEDIAPFSKLSSLVHSSPTSLTGKGIVSDSSKQEMDSLAMEDLQEPVKDAEEVSVTEDLLQKPEHMLSDSSEERPVTSDFVPERDGTAGILKRKRSAPDQYSDLSEGPMGQICSQETSADGISSLSETKTGEQINRHSSCFKRKRMDRDSQYEGVSCSNTTDHGISLCEEASEKTAVLRTEEDMIAGSSSLEDMTDKNLDQDVADKSILAQKLNEHGLVHSPTIVDTTISPKEDSGRLQVSDSIGTFEECRDTTQLKDSSLNTPADGDHNACVICKLGGKLLCCDGKGCQRSYHLSCLDPPLKDAPAGTWHCLLCVKKKLESGVHSVSGVESVWDDREVEVSDHEGVKKEKQYLVKYRGLAHVHNRWISESQLLFEAPMVVAKFNRRHQKDKIKRWKSEWTVPQRLVKKRLLMTPKEGDEFCFEYISNNSNCRHEWLVKWCSLGYEHATWELENAPFFSTREAMLLVKDYEMRHEKAKQRFYLSRVDKKGKVYIDKLKRLPSGCPPGLDDDNLNYINKLRQYWHKCRNAVVIDDQDRITKVILFILSLQSEVYRPFLIISSSTVVPVWEAEFLHLAPSVNTVVYTGNKDVRDCIRKMEFYDDRGYVLFQVLLSSPDAIVEDIEAFQCLEWEAIIVDYCQHSRLSKHFKQISELVSDLRLVLASGQMKDNVSEYLNLLSFIESGDGLCACSMKSDSNDVAVLSALKERLSRYLAYERKSDTSKFVEYWVPVWLSNVQVEQYCATLLKNSISLCSCSKNDPVGAFRDVLISTRKCCDHPYLVDVSLQGTLTKGHPEVEYLDIGVNASGKLKLLDRILQEIKKQGLRVMILFQSVGGCGRSSIGDILDDFLRQRFGPDSYERVDSVLVMAKKQAALNMFNNKERGRFVFLLENRACQPSIKLSALDAVIIFDSDWNPLNDLRALQKINIDSQLEQLKVFRLYSYCTVEEKMLILSKQDVSLESNIQNISRSTGHMLLTWGASYLFDRLDEFHGSSSPSSGSATSSEQSLLNDAVSEILTQLPHGIESNNTSNCNVILKVQHSGTAYSRNISLLGELRMKSTEEELPHIFWKKLLDGRYPQWRYLSGPPPRARRKVQYIDELPVIREAESEDARKKRKKVVNGPMDSITGKTWVEDKRKSIPSDKETKKADVSMFSCSSDGLSLTSPKKGPIYSETVLKDSGGSRTETVKLQQLPKALTNNDHPMAHIVPEASEPDRRIRKLRDAQKNLLLMLEPEIAKLCDTLRLPEDVKHMAGKCLEYIMNNHHVNREQKSILQAFQISLCWTAAAFLKNEINHEESLMLAKKHLNFECKEEEAETVYSKLQKMERMFSHLTESTSEETHLSVPRNEGGPQHVRTVEATSDQHSLEEGEIREDSKSCCLSPKVPVEQEQEPECEPNTGINQHFDNMSPHIIDGKRSQNPSFLEKSIRLVEKVSGQRMSEILLKQQDEFGKFIQFRDRRKVKLEEEYNLEANRISKAHRSNPARLDMLKKHEEAFSRKRAEFDSVIMNYQKKLVSLQQVAREKEKHIKTLWLEAARSGQLPVSFAKLPLPNTGFMLENTETSGQNKVDDCAGDALLSSGSPSELKNGNSVVSKTAGSGGPTSVSVYAPTSVVREGMEDVPTGNVNTTTVQSSSRIVVSLDSDGVENTGMGKILVGIEQHSEADNSSNTCSSSSAQEHQAELPSSAQSHTNLVHDDTEPSCVVTSIDHNQSLASAEVTGNVPTYEGQSSPHQTEILRPHLVSDMSLEVMQLNNSGSGSESVEQLQRSTPIDVPSIGPNQPMVSAVGSEPEPSAEGCMSQQAEGVPGEHNQQITSASGSQPTHSSEGCMSQQDDMVTQHPSESLPSQVERHNDSVSQPLGQLPQQDDMVTQHPSDALQSQVERHNDSVSQPLGQLPQQEDMVTQNPSEALQSQVERHNDSVSQPLGQLPSPVFTEMLLGGMPAALPGSCTGMPQESSIRLQQTFRNMTVWQSQGFHIDPFQNELAKMHREEEKTIKMHEDEKIRLKSECEREIEEVRRKYNGFIHEAEITFLQRKKAIEMNINTVNLNLFLADAFKAKGTTSKQGLPTTFSRQPCTQSLTQIAQRPPGALGSIQISSPPAQFVQHSPAISLGNPATTHISPLIPPPVNLQVGTQLRAPAPHLQPFRPTSMPAANHIPPLSRMSSQQLHNSLVTVSLPPPQLTACPPSISGAHSGTHLPNGPSALPSFHNLSSAMDLLMDIGNRSGSNLLNLPPLSEPGSIFDSLMPINLAMGGSGQISTGSDAARPTTAMDVVCLSDDD